MLTAGIEQVLARLSLGMIQLGALVSSALDGHAHSTNTPAPLHIACSSRA